MKQDYMCRSQSNSPLRKCEIKRVSGYPLGIQTTHVTCMFHCTSLVLRTGCPGPRFASLPMYLLHSRPITGATRDRRSGVGSETRSEPRPCADSIQDFLSYPSFPTS